MRRFNAFMPQPQRDGGDINPRLEQSHCRSVTNHVWRDGFALQTRTAGHGLLDSLLEEVIHAMARQRLPLRVGKCPLPPILS
jgi:hypothetical protein